MHPWRHRWRSGRRLATAAVLGLALAVSGTIPASGAPSRTEAKAATLTRVVVRALPDELSSARAATEALAGNVVAEQPQLGMLVADVPADGTAALSAAPGVAAVTPDTSVRLAASGFDPSTDPGGLPKIAEIIGAPTVWAKGGTGRGVGVAVLDSGVAPVAGLTGAGKVVLGPDLSFESQVEALRNTDTYGHGTHIAGIIAGQDRSFRGVAPDAHVVSLKLADARGATDVSQVIAAIDWVVQHRDDRFLNIRVLNLSFGTDARQSWRLDPLAFAAEVAWSKGIVVVVSAGNRGTAGMTNPAYNPAVIAVGAVDTRGTATVDDDTVPAFSSRGNGIRNPDVVAPGVSVVSLRVGRSYIDQAFGSTGRVGARYFRGTGTSQAAAVVSGAAALLLSERPELTPQQVKRLLGTTARSLPGTSPQLMGTGLIDVAAAAAAPAPVAPPAIVRAFGGGSLDASRGTMRLVTNGVPLLGEVDIFGRPVDTALLARQQRAGTAWIGGRWNGSTWAGDEWTKSGSWGGQTWAGQTWAGQTWAGQTWAGQTWAGQTWAGQTWAGQTWAGQTWAGQTWAGQTWAGNSWGDQSWR